MSIGTHTFALIILNMKIYQAICSYPVSLLLPDAPASAPHIRMMIRIGDQMKVVERLDGRVTSRPGRLDEPVDLEIEGSPPVIIGMLAGRLPLEVATKAGFLIDGSLSVLDQLRGTSMGSVRVEHSGPGRVSETRHGDLPPRS